MVIDSSRFWFRMDVEMSPAEVSEWQKIHERLRNKNGLDSLNFRVKAS